MASAATAEASEVDGEAGWSPAAAAAVAESLLPQLPDDMAIQCIARVPRFFYPRLALVSRAWCAVIRSPDLFASRISAGASRPFLCVDVRTSSEVSRWYLIDLQSGSPRPLVPLPPPPIQAAGSACAALGPLLFVLGGSVEGVATAAVQIFDARFNRWRLGPRMRAAREFAAAGTVDGRMYVAGGCLPSCDHWAEVLEVQAGRWAPVASPVGVREKWMHGSVVLEGKLLAVADRGGLLFDPAAGTWSPVSTVLDMGWKGRAAVVDGIIYSYDFLGKVKGFDPAADKWREVEGVNEDLPKFLSGATLANLGGFLCVLWEGKKMNGRRGMEIMCAAIKVDKADAGRLRGKIVWAESINFGVPKGSTLSHCLPVEV